MPGSRWRLWLRPSDDSVKTRHILSEGQDARQFPPEEPSFMNDEGFHWRAVLGIDGAWTVTEPSGVAAAVEMASGWRLAAVAASYDQFIARANGVEPGGERPRGSKPSAADLLDAARRICGARVDLVAVDMPMARHPITEPRPCDKAISSKYGARGAGTHSPSASRPGAVSDTLRADFEAHGYALCTCAPARGLIEVYPHPSLIEFLKAPYRLEYKAAKTGQILAPNFDRRAPAKAARRLGPDRRGPRCAHRGREGGAAAAGARESRLAPQGLRGQARRRGLRRRRDRRPEWKGPSVRRRERGDMGPNRRRLKGLRSASRCSSARGAPARISPERCEASRLEGRGCETPDVMKSPAILCRLRA